MLTIKHLSLATAIAAASFAVSASANTVVVPGSSHVKWTKSASGDLNNLQLSDRTAGVVFIRPSANNQVAPESSTNIGLDGRFLTSLQDGHYSAGVVCAGNVKLSAIPTAAKVNDLAIGAATINLKAGETQYFLVGTEQNYVPVLQQISAEQARQVLSADKTYKQNHQISRVNPENCPAPAPVPAPVVPAPAPVPAPTEYYVETRPNVRLNILFDFDKSNIKSQYQGEVAKAAAFLSQYPDAKAIIEGHTDSVGSDAYNQRLSERRANAVREALIKNHGIAANRLTAQGFGESRPVATNSTDAGRQENRRVMVVIPSE
ncbi:Outer membrane protein OmpA [Moraxella cuniculi DSM 21768]|uniref:Outer membrane protein OmpA n=2 Tax=Moraxella cuniculi TaxID=34061 RepID=A0A1N7FPX3_9GAMM|nr:OmpA family protein [Moraxella cuniculi]OOS07778.1 hypothetical protein B0189_02080 [Moraxella cuniculi]SIS02347.1 Outer membrane protein OmpA [Moraxella cuniculi DSM 21768]VEG14015.1 Outer membrane porin F precursor [Moraxella cuniculi]VEG14018.1 Outer membrane porin F precursor [Moraxella cuniculi]